jgi:hypothetical protein
VPPTLAKEILYIPSIAKPALSIVRLDVCIPNSGISKQDNRKRQKVVAGVMVKSRRFAKFED